MSRLKRAEQLREVMETLGRMSDEAALTGDHVLSDDVFGVRQTLEHIVNRLEDPRVCGNCGERLDQGMYENCPACASDKAMYRGQARAS